MKRVGTKPVATHYVIVGEGRNKQIYRGTSAYVQAICSAATELDLRVSGIKSLVNVMRA